MHMPHQLTQLRDPETAALVTCRLGPDGIALPRRHRKGWDRLGPEAKANREAERRAARLYNRQRNRVAWPPPLPGEPAGVMPPPAPAPQRRPGPPSRPYPSSRPSPSRPPPSSSRPSSYPDRPSYPDRRP